MGSISLPGRCTVKRCCNIGFLAGNHSLGESSLQQALMDTPTVPSFLQVFAGLGGLALLAEHLPHAYHQMAFDQSSWQSLNKEYSSSLAGRKIEEDIFGDDSKEDEVRRSVSMRFVELGVVLLGGALSEV